MYVDFYRTLVPFLFYSTTKPKREIRCYFPHKSTGKVTVKSEGLHPPMRLPFLSVVSLSISTQLRIQVCQNTDCCKRWRLRTPLPDVISDLLGDGATVETTSCLSQCGSGPNICVTSDSLGEVLLNGLKDANTAVAYLEEVVPDLNVPSRLLAAVNVLEKAHNGTFYNVIGSDHVSKPTAILKKFGQLAAAFSRVTSNLIFMDCSVLFAANINVKGRTLLLTS